MKMELVMLLQWHSAIARSAAETITCGQLTPLSACLIASLMNKGAVDIELAAQYVDIIHREERLTCQILTWSKPSVN